jgi:hypothetical protein
MVKQKFGFDPNKFFHVPQEVEHKHTTHHDNARSSTHTMTAQVFLVFAGCSLTVLCACVCVFSCVGVCDVCGCQDSWCGARQRVDRHARTVHTTVSQGGTLIHRYTYPVHAALHMAPIDHIHLASSDHSLSFLFYACVCVCLNRVLSFSVVFVVSCLPIGRANSPSSRARTSPMPHGKMREKAMERFASRLAFRYIYWLIRATVVEREGEGAYIHFVAHSLARFFHALVCVATCQTAC